MTALMTVAVVGAAIIGEWNEAAVVVFLFSLSETLEGYTMDRARHSLRSLMELAPRGALVRRQGREFELPVEQIQIGDILLVRPGERIAMDGRVTDGRSVVNQAAITGESLPADKAAGDEVFAGTVNGPGGLEVSVTKLTADSTFARIVHLVEEAQTQRAPSQTLVDRFTRVYTPLVLALSALIMIVPPLFLAAPWQPWIYRGLALLVVACPCALIISTPVSILSAISNAARRGVLIKGGDFLERIGAVKVIAFDKTGTLTRGEPVIAEMRSLAPDLSPQQILCLAASVESRSEHPLARAIVQGVTCEHDLHSSTGFEAFVGRGATALVDGRAVYVGSPRFFSEDLGVDLTDLTSLVDGWQANGCSVILVGDQKGVVGAIAVADAPRPESGAIMQGLRDLGIRHTVMLTGDNPATAESIAKSVNVNEVRAGLLPHEKVKAVLELEQQHGAIAMVGDGVNDAPALAAASVGIAMGGAGTDVALETADIVLMADDLSKLPFLVRLSRGTLRVIRQNIAIALGLKLLALLLVFPGWLTLWLAIVADMGATIIVTLNGMRLLRVRP